MQNAQMYLEMVRHRGERRLELRRVYRQLKNREFYLMAYAKQVLDERPVAHPGPCLHGGGVSTCDCTACGRDWVTLIGNSPQQSGESRITGAGRAGAVKAGGVAITIPQNQAFRPTWDRHQAQTPPARHQ